jgi:hypothetical protein
MVAKLTRRLLALLGAVSLSACAGSGGPSQAEREASAAEANALAAQLAAVPVAPPGPGEIRVRLVFGEAADLDLYVTDPLQETVYFANSPSRSGGRLERDVRCGEPLPRIETIEFAATAPGRYRVGVDFPPEVCSEVKDAVPFVVVFESHDERQEKRLSVGRASSSIVLEVDLR